MLAPVRACDRWVHWAAPPRQPKHTHKLTSHAWDYCAATPRWVAPASHATARDTVTVSAPCACAYVGCNDGYGDARGAKLPLPSPSSLTHTPACHHSAPQGAYGLSGRRLPMKRTMTSSASFHSTTSIRGAGGGVVSYRDSKLTMLLRDSLGGRSLALMIACCTPTMSAAHETKRTLQFAMGVKRVRSPQASVSWMQGVEGGGAVLM